MAGEPMRGCPPVPVSSFVGRRSEVTAVRALIRDPGAVTLCGPPGVGKTRLALEVANSVAASTSYWVDLATIAHDADVPDAVAVATGVHEGARGSTVDHLSAQLRGRRTLMVLDNCEHVLGGCRRLVDTLVDGCPDLTVVATSREPLEVAGERLWSVSPLSSQDGEELFYERASASAAALAIDDESAAAISTICQRLEGIPLAIELAAARVAVLALHEIAAYLERDPVGLLGSVGRGPDARHRSLQDALDWSYRTLSEQERALLAALSVFAGGGTAHAARAVCTGPLVPAEKVEQLLEALVRKSLAIAQPGPTGMRYRLLETVRAYAADRLDAGERDALRIRHRDWYVAAAVRLGGALAGPGQLDALRAIDSERANLDLAFRTALDSAPEHALRLAASLTLWWRIRGRFSDGRRRLHQALDRGHDAPPVLRGWAWWGVGVLDSMLDEHEGAAAAAFDTCLVLAREAGDVALEARALLGQARAPQVLTPDTMTLVEASAGLAARAGDRWCWAQSAAVAAECLTMSHAHAEALSLLEDVAAHCREAGDAQGRVTALLALGVVCRSRRDLAVADAHLSEALDTALALGDQWSVAFALLRLADVHYWMGDSARATGLLEESLSLLRTVGRRVEVSMAVVGLGYSALARDERDGAEACFREVDADPSARDDLASVALRGLGLVAMRWQDFEAAQRLFDAALARALDAGSRGLAAAVLCAMASMAARQGDVVRSMALRRRGLALWLEDGDMYGLVSTLEAFAGTTIEAKELRSAARLLGASEAIRSRHQYQRTPRGRCQFDDFVGQVRSRLPADEFDAAWREGAQMSPEDAVSSATKCHGRVHSRHGWSSLTGTEKEVVRLVGDGYTNSQVAYRLSISVNTVRGHLASVFAKLDVPSRAKLRRVALHRDADSISTNGAHH